MNKLTKMLVALMFLVLLLALVSCGGGGTDNNTPTPTNDQGFSPIPPDPMAATLTSRRHTAQVTFRSRAEASATYAA
jgi:hypothetical protein